MSGELSGRHVVVTGGLGALGQAVVARAREQGAQCHVPEGVDLADEAATAAYFRGLPPPWASVHLVGGFSAAPLEQTSAEEFLRLWRLNVLTCFLSCREVVARMRAVGDGGRIVNVAARPALVATGGMSAYAAAKSAVVSLTVSLAEELAAAGIWVNAVAPSIMDTPANRAAMPCADFSRWPSVDDVASTILQLASPRNAVGRGAVVPVYGRS
jgi:NAD(P)-dependent dehydrogenase (short-subunit alcohol dehydrogenase family)